MGKWAIVDTACGNNLIAGYDIQRDWFDEDGNLVTDKDVICQIIEDYIDGEFDYSYFDDYINESLGYVEIMGRDFSPASILYNMDEESYYDEADIFFRNEIYSITDELYTANLYQDIGYSGIYFSIVELDEFDNVVTYDLYKSQIIENLKSQTPNFEDKNISILMGGK